MKIALLNDTHFGVRNDSPVFMEYQNKFYNEIFFPYLIENDIKTLIHLGDVVDRRKFINHNTAHNFKNVFWNRLEELGIDTHIIIGNHDTYYKNTNEVNAMQNLELNKNCSVYENATEKEFDGCNILFVPWICDKNYDDSLYAIDNSQSTVLMGHLEVKGFEMHAGHINDHGLEKNLFDKFELVLSGHFHKKSDDGRIFYLGTQYEMTWSDYKCPKGFHVFDTNTRTIETVRNKNTIFEKIYYNDAETDYLTVDINQYNKKHVKLFVTNKTNDEMYNMFIDRLYNKINLHELTVIEDNSDLNASVRDDILEQGEDTLTFLNNYIDQVEADVDKTKLKAFAKELYVDASE